MAERTVKKEVSCLALSFYYGHLATRGIPREEIQRGLPYTPEYMNGLFNWIDYASFQEIERRMSKLFADEPDIHYKIGRSVSNTGAFGFMMPFLGIMFGAEQIYYRMPSLVRRFLFPFVEITFERVSINELRAHYVFDKRYPASDAFFETVRGMLEGFPVLIGNPPSKTSWTRRSDHEAVFDITLGRKLPRSLQTLNALSKLVPAKAFSLLGRIGTSWNKLLEQHEETNQTLLENLQELSVAKANLDRKVEELTVVNAIITKGAEEKSLVGFFNAAFPLIAAGFADAPIAILLAEGAPPGLVIAAQRNLKRDERRAMERLSAPGTQEVLAISRSTSWIVAPIGWKNWLSFPLRMDGKFLGSLLFGRENPTRDDLLILDIIMGELAMIVANLHSYEMMGDVYATYETQVQRDIPALTETSAKKTRKIFELEDARNTLDRLLKESVKAKLDLKTAYEELESHQVKLVQSEKLATVGVVAVTIAHEINNSLAAILSGTDLLDTMIENAGLKASGDYKEVIESVLKGINRVKKTVDDLQAYSRKTAIDYSSPYRVKSLVDESLSVAMKDEAFGEKGIKVGVEASPTDLTVFCDPDKIVRVFINVAKNAFEAVENEGRLTVRIKGDETRVAVEFEDNSRGIPAEVLSRVFEPFFTTKRRGLGLGLATCKSIVEGHGGRIAFDSVEGRGTKVVIELPMITPP